MLYFLSPNHAPLQHISSGRLQTRASFTHPNRNIDSFVILVGLHGTLYITQDHREYELKANEYLILFPGHTHFGHRASEGELSYFWCHFTPTIPQNYELVPENALPEHAAFQVAEETEKECLSDFYILPEHGTLSSADRTILIFRQLLDFAKRDCYSNHLANYTLSLLGMEISQEYVEEYRAQKNESVHYHIAEIMEWIRINYDDDLTVQKIAWHFNYNPDYLSATFKKYTGVPLLRYINQTKLSVAKKLLLDSNTPIKQIAFTAGFHDEKHFMKLFKQMEDMTPSQYRNAFYRQKLNNK